MSEGLMMMATGLVIAGYVPQIGHLIIPATYTDIVPDTFGNGSEAVLKGKLDGQSFAVEPDGVMAKCPSKYSPQVSRAGAQFTP